MPPLHIAVDNLLDAEYATVFGYASPGLAALAMATIPPVRRGASICCGPEA